MCYMTCPSHFFMSLLAEDYAKVNRNYDFLPLVLFRHAVKVFSASCSRIFICLSCVLWVVLNLRPTGGHLRIVQTCCFYPRVKTEWDEGAVSLCKQDVNKITFSFTFNTPLRCIYILQGSCQLPSKNSLLCNIDDLHATCFDL